VLAATFPGCQLECLIDFGVINHRTGLP
jgi:hypothetical protein